MIKSDIKSIDELCEQLLEDKIQWGGKKKEVLFHQLNKIGEYKKGSMSIRKLIAAIYPLRYIWACWNCARIISFREDRFRQEMGKRAKEDILNNIEKYKKAYELLDEESQKVYIDMLLYRLTGDYAFSIRAESSNAQYFSDKILWEKGMTIVDCGAYIGDTLSEFLKRKINIKNYYLYELDDDNYIKCEKVCKLAEDAGIKIHLRKKGVYSYSDTLYFEANADSSRIVGYPTETSIPVVAIDEDITDTVSFIKMDIEGSELEAINGAAHTIKRDKPVLAICIYHKQEDFWKIPLRIKEICPEYQNFWIEQYSLWDIETVLFVSL